MQMYKLYGNKLTKAHKSFVKKYFTKIWVHRYKYFSVHTAQYVQFFSIPNVVLNHARKQNKKKKLSLIPLRWLSNYGKYTQIYVMHWRSMNIGVTLHNSCKSCLRLVKYGFLCPCISASKDFSKNIKHDAGT